MIVKYRIQTWFFEGEIEVEANQWVVKASGSGNCKWMEGKSFWYIKKEIELRDGKVEEIK